MKTKQMNGTCRCVLTTGRCGCDTGYYLSTGWGGRMDVRSMVLSDHPSHSWLTGWLAGWWPVRRSRALRRLRAPSSVICHQSFVIPCSVFALLLSRSSLPLRLRHEEVMLHTPRRTHVHIARHIECLGPRSLTKLNRIATAETDGTCDAMRCIALHTSTAKQLSATSIGQQLGGRDRKITAAMNSQCASMSRTLAKIDGKHERATG